MEATLNLPAVVKTMTLIKHSTKRPTVSPRELHALGVPPGAFCIGKNAQDGLIAVVYPGQTRVLLATSNQRDDLCSLGEIAVHTAVNNQAAVVVFTKKANDWKISHPNLDIRDPQDIAKMRLDGLNRYLLLIFDDIQASWLGSDEWEGLAAEKIQRIARRPAICMLALALPSVAANMQKHLPEAYMRPSRNAATRTAFVKPLYGRGSLQIIDESCYAAPPPKPGKNQFVHRRQSRWTTFTTHKEI
jgi:hypothetical protein